MDDSPRITILNDAVVGYLFGDGTTNDIVQGPMTPLEYDQLIEDLREQAKWEEEKDHGVTGLSLLLEDAADALESMREPDCTCGAKTPQGQFHKNDCPARKRGWS